MASLQSPLIDHPIFYHYCSFEVFYNIVRNKTVRATDMRYLNDTKELGMVDNYIVQATKRLTGNDPLFEEHFFKCNRRVVRYVFCLSRECHSLDMAVKYADNCRGVVLGFDAHKIPAPQCYYSTSATVRYSREEHEAGMDKHLLEPGTGGDWDFGNINKRLVERFSCPAKVEAIRAAEASVAMIISQLLDDGMIDSLRKALGCALYSASLKDKSYASEQEERYIYCATLEDILTSFLLDKGDGPIYAKETQFRFSKFGLTPYIDVPFSSAIDECPLAKIYLPPERLLTPGMKDNVKHFLQTSGFSADGIEIEHWEHSYR